MYLLEPSLLASLDWPRIFLVCAACGATSISLCLVGAVIALMPSDDKLNSRTRAKALRAALTMAFAVSFIVEVGALALATRHGTTFADYVRWSLQLAVAGAVFVIVVAWWTDRAEARNAANPQRQRGPTRDQDEL
jgi:cytochrome bd-type quinol oxidase subunit 2